MGRKSVESNSLSTLTALLFWCALVVVSSVYITIPLVSSFAKEFGVTYSTAAAASSAFSLFYAFGFLLFGPLSDRYGRKLIIVVGMGMLAFITCTIAMAGHFYSVTVLRGVQGFFAASFAPTALAFVFDVYPPEKRTTAVGWISFGFVSAGIFGQVIGDSIVQTFDWKMVFFFMGFLYLLSMAAVIGKFPRARQKEAKENDGPYSYFGQVKEIFSNKGLLFCYGITFTLLLTFIGMYTILGDYLQSVHSVGEKRIIQVRAAGLIGMALSPFAGAFVKRLGLLRVLRMGLGMSAASLICLGMADEYWLLVIGSILYVAGISITFPAIMMLVGELGGPLRAMAAAYYAFILFLGATAGPLLAIFLVQFWGYSGGFAGLAVLTCSGLVATKYINQDRAEV
ncbi:MFS transporter [Virgibacillus sediminis]|uniref:MFS transporter n=1 Tax=Virgibacillus sediminis TaxID=202260 RepID=A0ABV7A512_9BACI